MNFVLYVLIILPAEVVKYDMKIVQLYFKDILSYPVVEEVINLQEVKIPRFLKVVI